MSSIVEYDSDGKPKIKRSDTFCSILGFSIPSDNSSFSKILSHMDDVILSEHKVQKGALSNCHGDWYEWLIAISTNNYIVENNLDFVILQLPNIRQFDVASLYEDKLYSYIKDLREKVVQSSGVSLITSNPDFVIINTQNIELENFSLDPISRIDTTLITELEEMYKFFAGKCSLDNIVGYLSVKTSLRPDRRLQISHEGSLMKAIYVHLQTRDWIINPKGLRYFAASTRINDADKQGLKTVATHSITNVQSKPVAAVDEVFVIDSVADAEKFVDYLSGNGV